MAKKTVYESEKIEGLLFMSENHQKEFDKFLSSKEAINKFMIDYNFSLIVECGEFEELIETTYDDDKLVVSINTEQLEIALEVCDYDLLTYYFSDTTNDVVYSCGYKYSCNIYSILSKYLDEDYICEQLYEKLKSKLVIK